MKKKIIIGIVIFVLAILLIPLPIKYKDGGTIKYKSFLYTITKYHKLDNNYDDGYFDATEVKILGKTIYYKYDEEEPDKERIVKVNGRLYYDTGKESTAKDRCGLMDGAITSHVPSNEIPTKDNQSNFEGDYGFQYASNNTIELKIDDKFIIFENRDGSYVKTYTIKYIDSRDTGFGIPVTLTDIKGQSKRITISLEKAKLIEIGKTYEFEFVRSSSSTEINDNDIESIFENSEIISITETNRVGINQRQDKAK